MVSSTIQMNALADSALISGGRPRVMSLTTISAPTTRQRATAKRARCDQNGSFATLPAADADDEDRKQEDDRHPDAERDQHGPSAAPRHSWPVPTREPRRVRDFRTCSLGFRTFPGWPDGHRARPRMVHYRGTPFAKS